MSLMHTRAHTHRQNTSDMPSAHELSVILVSLVVCSLFSALSLSLTHMAAGCELMSRVENTRGRETEREKVEGEEGEGRRQGDEKTEGASQVFMMYCRRAQSL